MLPVATGVVAGIAAVSLVFGSVHGMTLGFGTHADRRDGRLRDLLPDPGARRAPSAGTGWRRWLHDGWPTVRLGLLTSVCGFAALVFSGFPGLAQLGVFSIAGLVARGARRRASCCRC